MIVFILNLAGAVALLLWAVRMIRTSVERAFIAQLRGGLRRAAERPLTALAGGTTAALMLQSSTAVAMLVVAFVGSGNLPGTAALTVLLGADLGSAIVARVLLAPIGAVIPLLLICGVVLFLRSTRQKLKQTGRLLIGLALALVALGMIRSATAPLAGSPLVSLTVNYLHNDLASAFALGALLAWLMHSSVAAVLTFVTFALEGLLPALPASALVLGANLGGAAIPVVLTLSSGAHVRRILAGNLLLRGGGALLVLLALMLWPERLGHIGAISGAQAINLHILFNLVVAVLALPLVRPVMRLAGSVVTDAPKPAPERLSALDDRALDSPERALACASRELLRMAERVQGMLVPSMRLFRQWDVPLTQSIAEAENEVDRMHFEIKLYVARIQEHRLDATHARRAVDLAKIANNLEEAADQISDNLVRLAKRVKDNGLTFSEAGWRDLTHFHQHVADNVRLALDVLITGDADSARQLVEEKDHIRTEEELLQARHLERLRGGKAETLETTNLHQEILRALKTVNTCFTLVAYPIAVEAGDLLSSRLAVPASHV